MNKRRGSYIIIAVLCLNLLPRPSNAFVLNEMKTAVIYDEATGEEEIWKKHYLPAAKVLKLVPKTTKMLDLAKTVDEDPIEGQTLIINIMNRIHYEREKLLVKWEKDNGYIDIEAEKDYEITPLLRTKLLKEIEEEEEREKKESNQFWWNTAKAIGSVVTFGVGFIVAGGLRGEIKEAGKQATILATLATTLISVMDVARGWIAKFWKEDLVKTKAKLFNPMKLPKNYKKVNVHSSF